MNCNGGGGDGVEAIESAYAHINFFCSNVGSCRNLCLKFRGGRWYKHCQILSGCQIFCCMNFHIMSIVKIIPAIIGSVTLTVNAASFDCGKAGTNIEKLICASEQLNELDEDLARKYKVLMARAVDDGLKKIIKNDQKTWLAKRNTCSNTACIVAAYQSRIDELCQNPVMSQQDYCISKEPHYSDIAERDFSTVSEATSPKIQNLNLDTKSENNLSVAALNQNQPDDSESTSQQEPNLSLFDKA